MFTCIQKTGILSLPVTLVIRYGLPEVQLRSHPDIRLTWCDQVQRRLTYGLEMSYYVVQVMPTIYTWDSQILQAALYFGRRAGHYIIMKNKERNNEKVLSVINVSNSYK